jgi:hypothetical protein
MLTCGDFGNEEHAVYLTFWTAILMRSRLKHLFARAGTRITGSKRMRASHRRPARVLAWLLPSLYDAMGAIIGAELRSKFDAPSVLPSYLDDLLKELDERLEESTHSERPTNR